MSRIVGLILLNSCNCSYSVYLIDRWVDDRQHVDVVSRYLVCLRVPSVRRASMGTVMKEVTVAS